MKKNDNLEDLFKDSFEDFEADVKPKTWDNIQAALKGAGIGIIIKTLINKIGTNTIIAVVSSAATVIGTIMIMNWTGTGSKKETVSSNTTTPTPPKTEETTNINIVSNSNTNNAVESTTTSPLTNKTNTTNTENTVANSSKKSKAELENVVKEIESKSIASINSNVVAGAVPLIVNLSNAGAGKINKWNFGDGKTAKNISNPVHVYDVPGIYTVVLNSTTIDGKTKNDSIKIEVYGNSSLSSIPTTFTPNEDGDQDFFIIKSENIKGMNATILEGNGTIVYSYKGVEIKWDGRNKKGEKAKEGLYYYIIDAEGIDGKKIEKKGSIKLTR
jgi:gliding motility-associated-like protein